MGLVHSSFIAYPTPRNLNYWWTFGGILSVMLVAQIVTGVVLAMHYTPETTMAFNSVEHIMRDVNYGWLLRYAHANGASMFFLAVYIHIARGMYYGSYKDPREVLWILGVIIFLLMMATAFMGYVLPWGQMSFWGATVITNLFSAIPFVGDTITTWLWGGYSVDNPTLNRFFALHYLLPFMIAASSCCTSGRCMSTGQNNPTGVEVQERREGHGALHALRDAEGRVRACRASSSCSPGSSSSCRTTLAIPTITSRPIRSQTPAHIVPEWYFLPFYAILRAIPSKLGGVIAMFGSIALLAFLPWLDTSRVRSAVYRPVYKVFFWVFVPDGDRPRLSRLAAAGRRRGRSRPAS